MKAQSWSIVGFRQKEEGLPVVVPGIMHDPSRIIRDPGALNGATPSITRHAAGIIRDRLAITADTQLIDDDAQRIWHDIWRIPRDTQWFIRGLFRSSRGTPRTAADQKAGRDDAPPPSDSGVATAVTPLPPLS